MGILYLVCRFFVKLKILLFFKKCSPNAAEYVEITDTEGNVFYIQTENKNFFKHNSNLPLFKELQFGEENISQYIINQNLTKTNIIFFEFRHNRYFYIDQNRSFCPLKFDLKNFTNKEIHMKFSEGIKSIKDYNFLLNKFDLNEINLDNKSFFMILILNFLRMIYLYQIFSVIIWYRIDYYSFATVVLITTIIIVIINSYENWKNYKRLSIYSGNEDGTVIRNIKTEMGETIDSIPKSTKFIVPGDIVELGENSKVPCDGVILEGFCTVNEADLTGESCHVMKTALNCDTKNFSYKTKKHFLFHGTKVIKCDSDKYKKKIRMLAINTRFDTARGNQLQNILFAKEVKNDFYSDFKLFLMGNLVIYFICSIVYIFTDAYLRRIRPVGEVSNNLTFQTGRASNFIKDNESILDNGVLTKVLDNLTVILPPSLPICLIIGSYFFNSRLIKKNITCIDDNRILSAGLVNIIILDKTGTLTEESLDLYGFQSVKIVKIREKKQKQIDLYFKEEDKVEEINNVTLDKIESETKIYNLVHTDFWRKFSKNPNDPIFDNMHENLSNNLIFFHECLACCHGIDLMGNELFGNSVDKIIFENVNWIQTYNNENKCYEMSPKNAFKITENLFKSSDNNYSITKRYKQTIEHRFEFSSKFQSMSVITHNHLDDSYRFFIKGAPEKIIKLCKPETLPLDFNYQLLEHTKKGLRVIACATKLLPFGDYTTTGIKRENYESDLTFLGLIIFKNKLKKDTKHVIESLNLTESKLIMATGDNPFTSISVAQESCIIPIKNINMYLFDIDSLESYYKIKVAKLYSENDSVHLDDEMDHLIKKNLISNKLNLDKEKFKRFTKFQKEINISQGKATSTYSIETEIIVPFLINDIMKLDNEESNDIVMKQSAMTYGYDNDNVTDRSNMNMIQKEIEKDSRKERSADDDIKKFLKYLLSIDKDENAILCISGKLLSNIIYKLLEKKEYEAKYEKLNTLLGKEQNKKQKNQTLKILEEMKSQSCFLLNEIHEVIYKLMYKLMLTKGKIFYRMSPNDKVDLVKLFKDEDPKNVIAMCGDGANDCGALLSSDVGISLAHKENNNITSHFYSGDESINCILTILRYGRANYENNLITFKYMVIYAVIQFASYLISFSTLRDFSLTQYFYFDFFIIMISAILVTKTGASYRLEGKSENINLFHPKYLVSVIGNIIIVVVFQFVYFYYFISIRVDDNLVSSNKLVNAITSVSIL